MIKWERASERINFWAVIKGIKLWLEDTDISTCCTERGIDWIDPISITVDDSIKAHISFK